MIIAVDEAIPYLQDAFAPLGEVLTFAGRSVCAADVRAADALIVRSVTRVDAHLLEGSSVRFLGTVTTGMDHLDLEYLEARGIQVANAAGCNAIPVSEWVVAALLEFAGRKEWKLSGKSLGIVGVGHIGSLVEKKAAALGMRVILCDPPLRESTGDTRYGFLDDVLDADVLTLHVPLALRGRYPTYHMIDDNVLKRLSSRQVLINSARGAAIDGSDLERALRERRVAGAMLDVWEGEPEIDYDLLALVELGTAHIAGSSLDSKVRGTAMIFQQLCHCFDIQRTWDTAGLLSKLQILEVPISVRGQEAVRSVVRQAYDIMKDDAALRSSPRKLSRVAAGEFDRLRDGYLLRPEFSQFSVKVPPDSGLDSILTALGFRITHPAVPAGNS